MTAAQFKNVVRAWPPEAIEEARERFCIAIEGGQQTEEEAYAVTFACVSKRLEEVKP